MTDVTENSVLVIMLYLRISKIEIKYSIKWQIKVYLNDRYIDVRAGLSAYLSIFRQVFCKDFSFCNYCADQKRKFAYNNTEGR